MRVLFSAFMVFIVIFLTAVLFLSGMGERLLISMAQRCEGESVLREASVTQYESTGAPHYTVKLEGIAGAPSLELHLATGNRLYDLKLMYETLSMLEKGSSIRIEWRSTFASGIVITGINGVDVVSPMGRGAFLVWLFLTVTGIIMLAFAATVTVSSFREEID